MKKKCLTFMLLGFTFVAGSLLLSGCGASQSESSDSQGSQQGSQQTSDENEMKMGIIKSIDAENKQITMIVMEGRGNFDENSKEGELPEGVEKPEFKEGERPEPPEGVEKPEFKEGEKPEFKDGEKPELPEGMEKPEFKDDEGKTYSISEDIATYDQDGNKIAISILKENDFVQFTADGDTLLTITTTDGWDMKKPEKSE